MVIRDSRGKVNVNNSWKSQITTPANTVRAISVSVDKLTSQVEAGKGEGEDDHAVASPAETVTKYRGTAESKAWT